MSANIDLVKSIHAAWERGDFSSSDWADPEIEMIVADGPSPRTSRGLVEMAASMREILSAYESLRAIAEEYRELDGGRVLVLNRNQGHGKGSGLEVADVEPRGANVFHIADGKVNRLEVWWNRDRALSDLGLA